MTDYSRREFIKKFGAFAALICASQSAFSKALFSNFESAEAFEFLVVGDSLIWGQGLREEHKFYYLIKQWLQTEIFGGKREVNLKVKAHSGASIDLHQTESDALRKAGIAETTTYPPEVNITFPSIRAQIDEARKEYANPQAVNLIMLTGGITDIGISTILNPFNKDKNNEEFKREIEKYGNEAMFKLLEHIAATFPNALIAVVGYYPFVSRHTPTDKLYAALLKLDDASFMMKTFINNPLNRLMFKSYRRKMTERSMIWAENSTLALDKAVSRLNSKFDLQRAVFVKSPITEENSYAAKNTLLWQMSKGGEMEDDLYRERKADCNKVLGKLKEDTQLQYRIQRCELATVGHPNIEGSRAIAESIKNSLKPFLPTEIQKTKVSSF